MRFLALIFFFIIGCASSVYKEEAVLFSHFLKEENSGSISFADKSKVRAKERMYASFPHVDASYLILSEKRRDKGGKKQYFTTVSEGMDLVYVEFGEKKISPKLREEEGKLRGAVNKKLGYDKLEDIHEKAIFDYRREAEENFDRLFEDKFGDRNALEELKAFVDEYAEVFFCSNRRRSRRIPAILFG